MLTRVCRVGTEGVVGRLLRDALGSLSAGAPARVLDCGGGSGSVAVPLARCGAEVTVVDVSADALATLQRRAADDGVADRVRAVQGEVESLAEAVGAGPAAGPDQGYDLVLAHGILAAVRDVPGVFAAIAGQVRPGGALSVLVANPVAAVLGRAMTGDLVAALAELRSLVAGPAADPAGPTAVRELCASHGLRIEAVHGVGVFGDLVPGAALDAPGSREALERLEAESCAHPPFRDIAARVHLFTRRD